MPPLDRLFHRNLAIAFAYQNQRRGLDRFDQAHRIALGVNRWVVIHRSAEERNHPFIDVVEAVVAQPVGEPGARNRSGETIALRLGPHGHVTAVAVSANADAFGINGILLYEGVHAGHDVAVIAAAEILHIALRERFPLSITPAWI